MPKIKKDPKLYLVGGAVRDELLGLKPQENDWLLVGSNVQAMLDEGYKAVGKDFPVFLHPKTGEEYALARAERKTGKGYHGFAIHTDETITLEDDLLRRDLTINAIAKTKQGQLIDPYGGQNDIKKRVLRHVSTAFSEDPLRVLRVARFMAQLAPFKFTLADETLELMKQLVINAEIQSLTPERIWKETEKALVTSKPSAYFYTLRRCGALEIIFPEIDALFGIPQTARYHPEIDAGIHTMMVLDRCAELSNLLVVRFAALTHDLGKAATPKELLPRHIGHEKRGLKPLAKLCERYRVPKKLNKTARLACEYHLLMHNLTKLKAATILDLIEKLDGFRQPEQIEYFALVCQSDSQGRLGWHNKPYPQARFLNEIYAQIKDISAGNIPAPVPQGPQIAKAIRKLRIEKIETFKLELSNSVGSGENQNQNQA